jgi:hypothetical protein
MRTQVDWEDVFGRRARHAGGLYGGWRSVPG